MPVSKEEAALDAEFTAKHANAAGSKDKSWDQSSANKQVPADTMLGKAMQAGANAVEPAAAMLRGAYSGATFGVAPGASDIAQQNAWEQHPGAYGVGYTGGTLANMLITEGLGGIAKAALAAKAAPAAAKSIGFIAPEVTNAEKAANVVNQAIDKGTASMPKNTGNALRIGNGLYQWDANTPEGHQMINLPYGNNPKSPVNNIPLSEADQPAGPGQFATLANFLAQAKDSNNPAVQQAAADAQAAVDPNDPDAKRKIAMMLASTPQGRAVSNSESSVNDTEES